jgi:hypothetical protein
MALLVILPRDTGHQALRTTDAGVLAESSPVHSAGGPNPAARPWSRANIVESHMNAEPGQPKRRGYLNRALVVSFSFWMTTVCILVAVVASVLAIWEFTGTDALWRTVATCAVIGAGTLAFSWINGLFERGDR